MALTEIQRSRTQRGDKSGAAYVYRAEVVYTCPRSEVKTHEGRLWNTTYTGIPLAGPLPVMTIQVVGADPNQAGNSLLTVTYGRDLSYDPSTFPTGEATISLATRVTERPLTKGPGEKGLYLETGPDKNALSWRVVGGANSIPHVDAMISVRTSYDPLAMKDKWPSIIARLGKVNADKMEKMMGVQAAQAMLIHGNVPSGFRFGDPTTPIPIEYVFWVKPNGWTGRTVMQRYVHLPIKRPVLHEDTLEQGRILYQSKYADISVSSMDLARMRELGGSTAIGDPVTIGGNEALIAETDSQASSSLTGGSVIGPVHIPDPIQTAGFSDILELIKD